MTKVSKTLGYSNPSFISQMIGPKPTREITEKSARKFEERLGLQPGELDGAKVDPTTQLVANTIRLVGRACAAEGVSPSPDKFADLVVLALEQGTEAHVRLMARLLK